MTSRAAIPLAGAAVAAIVIAGGAAAWRLRSGPDAAPPSVASAPTLPAARREAIRRFWDAYRRAEAARLSGSPDRLAEAEARYREALALDAEHENALWGLANVLESLGRSPEAADLLRRHIEAHPRSTRGYARLGELLAGSGPASPAALDEAEALFRKAVALNPEESGGYVNLGRLLYARGRLDEAGPQFRSALKINFKSLAAARFLALIAIRRGDRRAAALELAPVVERFLADRPKLHALSEGDTLEDASGGALTPAARELLPAALLLVLLTRHGGAEGVPVPAGVADLASRPLAPLRPGGAVVWEPASGARPFRPAGSAGPRRTIEADLDGDGIADRFAAGKADAAESAAWILAGTVHCGDRAAVFESGLGGGRFERVPAGRSVAACLPSGELALRDVDGDGRAEVVVAGSSPDPGRVEPDVVLLPAPGPWRAALLTR
jgi:tetratricopeptide (TPR) repeat protein